LSTIIGETVFDISQMQYFILVV